MVEKNKTEHYEYALQVFQREMKRPANINDPQDKATVAILAIGIHYGRSGILLSKNDLAHLHDVLYNLTDITYTDDQLYEIWEKVPKHIKDEAIHWGISDTVVRGNIYVWAKENITTEETKA